MAKELVPKHGQLKGGLIDGPTSRSSKVFVCIMQGKKKECCGKTGSYLVAGRGGGEFLLATSIVLIELLDGGLEDLAWSVGV